MSRRIVHAVTIGRDADACWRAFTDTSRWHAWFPTLQRLERTRSDGPLTVGETLVLHLAFAGRSAPISVRIEELVDGARVRWCGRSFGVKGDHAFFIESLGPGRARFVSDETFSGLPVRLLPGRIFAQLEAETVAGLDRFRALVEGSAPAIV